jgi:2-polyprenyl-3-methyl-5-hydroxy-6-metoxy-1,4-benzoquinol methylase
MNPADIHSESENLRYMWNRLPASYLSKYLGRHLNKTQSFYARKIILDYLATKSFNIDFLREERLLRPLVNLYFKRSESFRTNPIVSVLFHRLIYFSSYLKLVRIGKKATPTISILDVGCGAGNYYKLFILCNLTPFLDYTGIDLIKKNIEVAKMLYLPTDRQIVNFSEGNILDIQYENQSFDIVMVNHVFEHLSPGALPVALKETIRVAKDLVIVNFFYEKDIPDHIINPYQKYHWNCLSRRMIIEILKNNGIKEKDITIIDKYPPFRKRKTPATFKGFPLSYSTAVIKKNQIRKPFSL